MRQIKKPFIFLSIILFSCTVPKDARQLKKATKDWRKSEKILWAYSDSPLGSTTLILRHNNKFELTSSGFFMLWFEAGIWSYKQDTITLSYVNKNQEVNKTQNLYLNSKNYKLYFQNKDSVELTLRIILNKLER